MEPTIWNRTLQVNLTGAFYIVQGTAVGVSYWDQRRWRGNNSSRIKPNEEPKAPRRFNNRSIVHLGTCRWGATVVRIFMVVSLSFVTTQSIWSHYTPTKAGVLSLMQSCAVALGKYNIRANSVLPGTIETSINADDLANPEKRNSATKRTALGRLGGWFPLS